MNNMNDITPAKFAQDLYDKFKPHASNFDDDAEFGVGSDRDEMIKIHTKKIAVICVENIIRGITLSNGGSVSVAHPSVYKYWHNVILEINNL